MSIRSHGHPQTIQNYPKIHIDRGNVIKPCVANQTAADQFIDKPVSSWKKFMHDIRHEGIPFILRCVSNLKIPVNANPYYVYLIKALKYIALLMLHLHRVYLYIYGYFYPYSLMSLDDICDEFSRCPKWTESVIRAFAWHPNQDRCALAVCNDYIYVYQGPTRIQVLRHNQQRKVVDMVWQPTSKDVLVVATQTHIILWRVLDKHGLPLNINPRAPNLVHRMANTNSNAKLPSANESIKSESIINSNDNHITISTNERNFKILESILPAPIVSIKFDQSGDFLYACSPNSSKIAVLDLNGLLNPNPSESRKCDQHIKYIRKFGQGVTKLLWSPEKNRLATGITSSFLRVFESFKWSCREWPTPGGIIHDMIWSKPSGRMLLIANKTEPCLYALPFLDDPEAKDVGGNKSLMKALDLTPTRSEFGELVGGCVQSLAWDSKGKRLAISFRDNPESILLFKTTEKPTVEFHQIGVIQSDNSSIPLLMDFHDKFRNGSLLTICWSDGSCQHLPLTYSSQEITRNGLSRNDGFNNSLDSSTNSFSGNNSSPKTPRSLTNFCQASGNNSISSFPSSLMPINKVQHQTTLYSLSTRSPLLESNHNNLTYTEDD